MSKYEIIPVESSHSNAPEPLGTKTKFWYKDASGQRMLFKAEDRGTGEDWAEKVACHFCEILGLPHVRYELAHDQANNKPGVICANCAPYPSSLVLGNQLLMEIDSSYPANERNKYTVREHSIKAVVDCLRKLSAPPDEWMEGTPELTLRWMFLLVMLSWMR